MMVEMVVVVMMVEVVVVEMVVVVVSNGQSSKGLFRQYEQALAVQRFRLVCTCENLVSLAHTPAALRL